MSVAKQASGGRRRDEQSTNTRESALALLRVHRRDDEPAQYRASRRFEPNVQGFQPSHFGIEPRGLGLSELGRNGDRPFFIRHFLRL